jgi:hypothetical protein
MILLSTPLFSHWSILLNKCCFWRRTYNSFETQLKKGILLNPTDYVIPTEICAMVNVVLGNDDIIIIFTE